MISTDAGASLPAKDGRVEVVNSSLGKYSEVTVCARFLTHHFSTHPDSGPEQIVIFYGDYGLLRSYITRPCDQDFQVNFYSFILGSYHTRHNNLFDKKYNILSHL